MTGKGDTFNKPQGHHRRWLCGNINHYLAINGLRTLGRAGQARNHDHGGKLTEKTEFVAGAGRHCVVMVVGNTAITQAPV